jgi:hypothetical protein
VAHQKQIDDLKVTISKLEAEAERIAGVCEEYDAEVSDLKFQIQQETDPSKVENLKKELETCRQILIQKQGFLAEKKAEINAKKAEIDLKNKEILKLQRQLLKVPKIAPDSERVSDILPNETHAISGQKRGLHFVNRDSTMKRLLRIHLEILSRRDQQMSNSGSVLTFPLMDSVAGMGKTTFAWKYLAMVARFVNSLREKLEKVLEPPLVDGEIAAHVEKMLFPLRKEPSPEGQTYIRTLLNELASARTLYVNCGVFPLFDKGTRDSNLMRAVRIALDQQWGVSVGDEVTWTDCLSNYITKPVFIVFDEIGWAFSSPDLVESRKQFLEFVTSVCVPLSNWHQVHYLLSGKGDFFSNVGIRAQDKVELKSSPGAFERVILNPIRRGYIAEITEKTFIDGKKVSESLADGDPDPQVLQKEINKLYIRTAGHPRSLLEYITAGKLGRDVDYTQNLLTEVRMAVELYRNEIQKMFEKRRQTVDLTQLFKNHLTIEISYQYLASRVFAGYDDTPESTQLYFPPAIESYLMRVFLPFSHFVRDQEYIIEKDYLDKSRIFEALLLKWFEAMGESNNTIGQLWNGFCPENSLLTDVVLRVDSRKTVEGLLILARDQTSSGPNTLSVEDFGRNVGTYLSDNSVNIYFPAPKSSSPDIFLIQPQEGGNADLLVGIQAKCLTTGAISVTMCESEAEKFNRILEATRSQRPGRVLNGVLIMCGTRDTTQTGFPRDTRDAKSFVWKRSSSTNCEIIIVNLSNPDMRKDFFGLALGIRDATRSTQLSEEQEKIFNTIERMINYQ